MYYLGLSELKGIFSRICIGFNLTIYRDHYACLALGMDIFVLYACSECVGICEI
jgi:hypothetical protein